MTANTCPTPHCPGVLRPCRGGGRLCATCGEWAPAADLVQLENPRARRFLLVDRALGRVVGRKRTPGPYARVPVART